MSRLKLCTCLVNNSLGGDQISELTLTCESSSMQAVQFVRGI